MGDEVVPCSGSCQAQKGVSLLAQALRWRQLKPSQGVTIYRTTSKVIRREGIKEMASEGIMMVTIQAVKLR